MCIKEWSSRVVRLHVIEPRVERDSSEPWSHYRLAIDPRFFIGVRPGIRKISHTGYR